MSSRQPLLTLSPTNHVHINPSESEESLKAINSPKQTTPKLPRRERAASFSRLLKNENFSEFTKNLKKPSSSRSNVQLDNCNQQKTLKSTVDIRVSPCSPPKKHDDVLQKDDFFIKSGKGYLSPNHLPFSPRLLNKKSPMNLSPSYRQPSPLRSPLYQADNRRNFLGRGSFGKVSLWKYKDTHFAVKIIYNPSQYIGEINMLGIRHPHLVELFHISTILDKTLICMEFAGHCNLQQIIDTKSELELRRKLSFCAQIASGLRHCHQHRIVHGDVKPANVMVSPLGICKLGDFGHSIRLDSYATKPTHLADDAVGTAAYAAPEILRGSCITPSSDMYSFGILLWQIETREMPFAGEHPHVIIYRVVHYGERPKFSKKTDPIMSLFCKTAESCWRTVPEERIDATQALSNIHDIMHKIKEGNVI